MFGVKKLWHICKETAIRHQSPIHTCLMDNLTQSLIHVTIPALFTSVSFSGMARWPSLEANWEDDYACPQSNGIMLTTVNENAPTELQWLESYKQGQGSTPESPSQTRYCPCGLCWLQSFLTTEGQSAWNWLPVGVQAQQTGSSPQEKLFISPIKNLRQNSPGATHIKKHHTSKGSLSSN